MSFTYGLLIGRSFSACDCDYLCTIECDYCVTIQLTNQIHNLSTCANVKSKDSIDKIVQDCESVRNNTTETFNDDDNDNDNGTDKIEEEKEGVEGKQLMLPYYFPFSSLLSSTNPLWMSRSNCVVSHHIVVVYIILKYSRVSCVISFLSRKPLFF